MAKKNTGTKSRIVSAAWKLFYDQGFDTTTIDDIIWESGTSKGSFYHYFESKEALLGSLAYLFDEKYEELECTISESENSIDVLLWLNRELFDMIEKRVDLELLKGLFASQLNAKGEKQLLDRGRVYYKLLRKIISAGQEKGEITASQSVNEIVRYYAFLERSLLYDWCMVGGEYSLKENANAKMPFFLEYIKNK